MGSLLAHAYHTIVFFSGSREIGGLSGMPLFPPFDAVTCACVAGFRPMCFYTVRATHSPILAENGFHPGFRRIRQFRDRISPSHCFPVRSMKESHFESRRLGVRGDYVATILHFSNGLHEQSPSFRVQLRVCPSWYRERGRGTGLSAFRVSRARVPFTAVPGSRITSSSSQNLVL